MKATEWKSLIQDWTGMTEEQWKVRQRFLKVSAKADNWRKKEMDLLFSIIQPFSYSGLKTLLIQKVNPTYEPSTLERDQLTLEATLVQQNLPKEKYLSKDLIDLLNYQGYSSHSLKYYTQSRIVKVCLEKWQYLWDVKFKHHQKLKKLQAQYGISGICPNVSKVMEETIIYPFLTPDYAETPDESSLVLVPKDLLILDDWKWALTDTFLSLAFKYNCNLYWRDTSIQSITEHGKLKEITSNEVLKLVSKYDKAEITDTWEENTNPYFVFYLSTGLETNLNNTLAIYALLNKKEPKDIVF